MTTFTFTLSIQELFDFCSEYTSKRIYDHKDPEGNIVKELVENYSIREDDKPLFTVFLKSGASEAFNAMKAASKSLTNAFIFNTPSTTIPIYAGGDIVFKGDFDDSVNPTQMEDALMKAMCYYVLMEWYIMKGFEQESVLPERNYNYNLSIIKNYGQGGGLGGGSAVTENSGVTAARPYVTI